jgi:glycosyltransferase involved in cell wall biosynthesis
MHHPSPLVSVIIPTYNRLPLLQEALRSVFSQSYRHLEVIVVDDGSSDGTAIELAKKSDSIRLIVQSRRGVAAARNIGVTHARGQDLAVLDSDDLWLREKLGWQVEFLEDHPGYEICQTDEIWIRRGVRVNPKIIHRKPSGDVFLASLDLCLVSPSAVMLTKRLFDLVGGFDEAFPVCEDYDLWLRIAETHHIALIEKALVIKRGGHADQLSHAVWGMDRYRVRSLQKLLRSGLSGERADRALAVLRRKVAILAQGARRRGKELEAQHYESILVDAVS